MGDRLRSWTTARLIVGATAVAVIGGISLGLLSWGEALGLACLVVLPYLLLRFFSQSMDSEISHHSEELEVLMESADKGEMKKRNKLRLRKARERKENEGRRKEEEKDLTTLAETKAQPEANYVNFSFQDTTENPFRPLKLNEGLYTNLVYKLVVSVEFTPDTRFKGVGKQPFLDRPPEKEMVILDVVLALEDNVEILGSPWAILHWPAGGQSIVNAEFEIKASAKGEARLKMLIFYEHDLLFCGDITMQVAAEGDEWTEDKQPISWVILDSSQLSLFRSFKTLDRDGHRCLNISVHKRRGNEYELFFFIRGTRGDSAHPAVYPLVVKLSDDEITNFLAKTRSALRLLIEDDQFGGFTSKATDYDGLYRGAVEGATPEEALAYSRAQQMLQDTAHAGHDLWSKLFGSDMGRRMASMLADQLTEEGSIVQIWIAAEARDFILPWVWLYPPEVENGFNAKSFWGYRFIIEQIRQKTGSVRPASVVSVASVRVASALHNFPTRSLQRKFFATYKARYDPAFNWLDIAPDECRAYLPRCDSHILYFYCHGHTEKRVSAYYDDLLKSLKAGHTDHEAESALLFEVVAIQRRQKIRDSSYIQIEDTVLKMSDLNQFAPAQSSWPLVFLNICESAELCPGATDNLIDAFLDHDAGGVIGTEMPMLTVFGDLMARRFFESYFSRNHRYEGPGSEGQQIGRVLWQLRRDFMDHGNPLAFAYTYFGDATTRFRPAVAHETGRTTASSI